MFAWGLLLAIDGQAGTKTGSNGNRSSAPQMERVGGNYELKEVSRKCKGKSASPCFRLLFTALAKTGRFDELVLESDHMNVAVRKGDRIRLSAEIAVDRGRTAEVSQLVLFRDAKSGIPPVWMLSRKHKAGNGPAARYLEMHAPQNDFRVL
jgi:hypothetical protein